MQTYLCPACNRVFFTEDDIVYHFTYSFTCNKTDFSKITETEITQEEQEIASKLIDDWLERYG